MVVVLLFCSATLSRNAFGQQQIPFQGGHFLYVRETSTALPSLLSLGAIEAHVNELGFPDGPSWLNVEQGDNASLVLFGSPPPGITDSINLQLTLVGSHYQTVPFVLIPDTNAPSGKKICAIFMSNAHPVQS